MATLLDGFAVLLFFGLIFWVALGGPSRRREREAGRRRMGGRRPTSSWLAPRRDHVPTPGLLLLAVALWQVAGVIATNSDAGDYVVSLVIFSVIIAAGFSIRPDIVGAGLGLVGVVSQTIERMQPSGCPVYTFDDNRTYWIMAGTTIAVLVGVRMFVTPISVAGRLLTGPVSFWRSSGHPRELGIVASTLLTIAGALDLVDLATHPDALAGLRSYALGLPILAVTVIAAVVLLVGLAKLPSFTVSVLGLGVVGANVIVAATSSTGCEPWAARIAIVITVLLVNRLANHFI
jgi:hypothetical protein